MLSLIAIAPFLLTFLLSLLITGLIKQFLSKTFLDIPNERSSHTQPTPRGGGLGFLVSFFLMYCSSRLIGLGTINISWAMWVVLVPLTVVGFIDDRASVSAVVRYLVQVCAASIAVGSFRHLLQAEGLFVQSLIFLITIIAFTAVINFYNFMDGLDGIVASVTAVQLAFFAIYLQQPVWWLLVGGLCGFLYWNWSPAKIFMGDVGSTVLGASVAIALLNAPSPHHFWIALTVILPLTGDAFYTLIRRLIRRENIFRAHRTHLYQRLQQSGWSHAQVAIAYLLLTGAIAFFAPILNMMSFFYGSLLTIGAIICAEIHLHYCNSRNRSVNE